MVAGLMGVPRIGHWVDGSPVRGVPAAVAEVTNPATGTVTGQVSLATRQETAQAVQAAADALQARVNYWGGLVDMSMDRLVQAGEQDGLFHSVGYSGHGVHLATHMGKVMDDYLDGDIEANPWGDVPFRRIPGHFGLPWFLPFAGAYYRFQDVIK